MWPRPLEETDPKKGTWPTWEGKVHDGYSWEREPQAEAGEKQEPRGPLDRALPLPKGRAAP